MTEELRGLLSMALIRREWWWDKARLHIGAAQEAGALWVCDCMCCTAAARQLARDRAQEAKR